MRKPVVPRFLLLLFLYTAIFITLVYLQFSKKSNFTLREGNLVIQGNYAPNQKQLSNAYLLKGKTSVFFGGMEFTLGDTSELSMTVTNNEVYFRLKEGPEVVFTTQYTGGSIELVIRVDFSALVESSTRVEGSESEYENAAHSLKIPFNALNTSVVQERDQQLLINANGYIYTFSRNTGKNYILLDTQNPAISYRVLPDKETVNPRDFIIPSVLNNEEYEATLALWLDQSYMLWNRTVASGAEVNGELVCAYMSEALKRGTYKAAAAAVFASWNPNNQFYESSPYIGKLDTAMRTLSTTERERYVRLARLFNEKSPDFLKEFKIIEFLAIRGYGNLMDDALEILRVFDPAAMTAAEAAGILEGRLDWRRYRPGRYNPFERFVDQALFVISENLRKNTRTGDVLVFSKTGSGEEEADIELNLRLGKELLQYEDETWNALGKTLILSVLSLADGTGAVPGKVQSNFIGERERLDSQSIYRICFAGENYAKAQAADQGIWAWTAASQINGNFVAGRLELSVDFPAGETHYMMLRGIKPFTTLQFNGITYNQDNQFERYDYSGWTYSAAEQTLLVKIRHRLPTERITIIYP